MVLALLLNVTPLHQAQGQTIGWSDNSISNVITAVANHWQHTLADGYYPGSNSLKIAFSAAQSATKPAGLDWTYDWGVNLYGQMRVREATGSTNWENFALNHNLICGRYYAWLLSLTNTLTSTTSLPNFQNTNAVFGSYFVSGRLDYCGSMTAQLLEGVMRHAGGPTIQQLHLATATVDIILLDLGLPDAQGLEAVKRALAAGADSVMLGRLLAVAEESPGEAERVGGRVVKEYRGMGSLGAMSAGSDRYPQVDRRKLVPEGVEARISVEGPLSGILYQLIGGTKAGMTYCGAESIADLRVKARFVQLTHSGQIESHPHDIELARSAPNYP